MATGSSSLSAEQLSEVLSAVKDCVRDEMQSLKRERVEEKEAAEDRLVKKAKLEKGPILKKKTHEKQFEFNSSVMDKLEDAETSLEKAPECPPVVKAREAIKEGNKLLKFRQKLIRIADRSEYGWATVEEYLEDELADGEDDEKIIQRSDFRAGKKLKASRGAKGKKVPFKKRAPGVSLPQGYNSSQASSSGVAQLVGALLPAISKWPTNVNPGTASGSRNIGPCFYCGKPGHFRKSCPLLLGLANK